MIFFLTFAVLSLVSLLKFFSVVHASYCHKNVHSCLTHHLSDSLFRITSSFVSDIVIAYGT